MSPPRNGNTEKCLSLRRSVAWPPVLPWLRHKQSATRPRTLGTLGLLFGLVTGLLMLGHLTRVARLPFEAEFTYDFRYYALILFGVVSLPFCFLCVQHASGVARGDRASWIRLSVGAGGLLLLNAPLVKLQSFSMQFTIAAAVLLCAALASRPPRSG